MTTKTLQLPHYHYLHPPKKVRPAPSKHQNQLNRESHREREKEGRNPERGTTYSAQGVEQLPYFSSY